MYAGVDVGGTKTLVAVLNDDGVIVESRKFPTPKNYQHFLLELQHSVAFLTTNEFEAAGVGIPGRIDRKHGRGIRFGNLPWKDVPVQADLERVLKCPVVVENDAKMAGLSESMLVPDKYSRVVYVTVSTGIGCSLIVDHKIDTSVGDIGGRAMFFEHGSRLEPWESFASGHAIVDRYGKMAKDIKDIATWKKIVRDLVPGFLELTAFAEPDVIIIGGSVGTYFDRYKKLLVEEMKKYETPIIKTPVFRQAQRPEEAVIYGCYDLAKTTFRAKHHHGKTA